MKAKITGIAHFLPERIVSSAEVENMLRDRNPHVRITQGTIHSVTGINNRHFTSDNEFNSTNAGAAAKQLFEQLNISPNDIDLLLFAAAGQDLLEPATAHIVQEMIGTNCTAFDVKNACNSFINALEVAEAFIVSGHHKKVLIVTGEAPSKSIKWELEDRADLKKSFAGYTLGDAGAAALIEPSHDDSGILSYAGTADSSKWSAGALLGGGSRHPRGEEFSYFQGDGAALKSAFEKIGPDFLRSFLKREKISIDKIDHVFIHQVSMPYLQSFISSLGLDDRKVAKTVSELGNIAATTLPLQMSIAEKNKLLKKGDTILLVGLAGGISLEAMLLRW